VTVVDVVGEVVDSEDEHAGIPTAAAITATSVRGKRERMW
jgi:hypothetical protein